jgi:uncharacterized membrane protein HdeD (DUF308 family)
MTSKPLMYVGAIFGALVVADQIWIWSLPTVLPTTSVAHRLGSFLSCLFLGMMALLQGAALRIDKESRSRRTAGGIAMAFGIISILAGVRIAYRHLIGN